jgi:methylated-DNA-[protein]-cysteine S-methyltransferase
MKSGLSFSCPLPTPLGELVLVGNERVLTGVYFADGRHPPIDALPIAHEPFKAAREQLLEYLAGERRSFDLALDPPGTPFQQRVWQALGQIPYGTTRAYGALARELGTGPRAVGLANGRNPLSIVIPCHRLVGGSGALTGYGGGLDRKRLLLEMERERAMS